MVRCQRTKMLYYTQVILTDNAICIVYEKLIIMRIIVIMDISYIGGITALPCFQKERHCRSWRMERRSFTASLEQKPLYIM